MTPDSYKVAVNDTYFCKLKILFYIDCQRKITLITVNQYKFSAHVVYSLEREEHFVPLIYFVF